MKAKINLSIIATAITLVTIINCYGLSTPSYASAVPERLKSTTDTWLKQMNYTCIRKLAQRHVNEDTDGNVIRNIYTPPDDMETFYLPSFRLLGAETLNCQEVLNGNKGNFTGSHVDFWREFNVRACEVALVAVKYFLAV